MSLMVEDIIQFPTYPAGSHNFLKRLLASEKAQRSDQHVPEHSDLDIAIVGAGVGGLSAAIALKRAKFNVTVYEGASALGEIGAGIQVPPNSARLLHSWGLEEALNKRGVKPEGLTWRRWQNGKIVGDTRFNPQFSEWYGAPYYVIHRAHLHDILHEKAVELGIPVKLKCKVAGYDLDTATFRQQDGTTIQADLIVAADGIRSTARRTILGDKYKEPSGVGTAAYRAAIPVKSVLADPETSWVANSRSLNLWVGHNTHAMTYSIAKGELFNMVLTHPEMNDPTAWDQTNALAEMKAVYAGWDPTLRKLLDMVTSTQKWPIQQIEIPSEWSPKSGKLVLLGDAAHAMLPNMALGAAMAVEDAATLAECLKAFPQKGQLRNALDLYESLRVPRTKAVREASVLHGFTIHYPDGPLQEARDAAMRPEVEGRHFVDSPNQWSDPMTQQFCYSYDPVEETRKTLEKIQNRRR